MMRKPFPTGIALKKFGRTNYGAANVRLGCRRHKKAINDARKAAMSDIELGPLERPAVR